MHFRSKKKRESRQSILPSARRTREAGQNTEKTEACWKSVFPSVDALREEFLYMVHELDMKLEDALPYMTSHVSGGTGIAG